MVLQPVGDFQLVKHQEGPAYPKEGKPREGHWPYTLELEDCPGEGKQEGKQEDKQELKNQEEPTWQGQAMREED